MGTIQALSLAMGTAWTSGINLYATVAALGIASRLEMIQLPPGLEVLSHPGVIAIACIMYVIEFVADKVPYVDTGWDVLHTFIRVPAGAILAARSLGDVNPALELMAVLGGGTIALVAHGTKATTRLAINASPEPFSNWVGKRRRRRHCSRRRLAHVQSPHRDDNLGIGIPRSDGLANTENFSSGEARLSGAAQQNARGQTGSARAAGLVAPADVKSASPQKVIKL